MTFSNMEKLTLLKPGSDSEPSQPTADILRNEYFNSTADSASVLQANFKKLDADNSGGLSKQELTDAYNNKYAPAGVHDASKLMLDNFDSATHISGHKKAFFLDFSEQGYLTDAMYKPGKLQNEVASSDLGLIVGASSDKGNQEMQSRYDEHGGLTKKLEMFGVVGATMPISGLAANSFLADAAIEAGTIGTVATVGAIGSAALLAGSAVVAGAVAVGAFNDYRHSRERSFSSVIEKELDTRRNMLSSWKL